MKHLILTLLMLTCGSLRCHGSAETDYFRLSLQRETTFLFHESIIAGRLPVFGSAARGRAGLPDSITIDLSGYTHPVNGIKTSGYGWRRTRMHSGLDLAAPAGTPVKCAFDGTVRKVGYDRRGYGNYVIVAHPNGMETCYAHLSRTAAAQGREIVSGQILGYVGSTGRSTGPHLHLETRIRGIAVDPELFIDWKSRRAKAPMCTIRIPRRVI